MEKIAKLEQISVSVDVIGPQCEFCNYLDFDDSSVMTSYSENIPYAKTVICKNYKICKNAIELKERIDVQEKERRD